MAVGNNNLPYFESLHTALREKLDTSLETLNTHLTQSTFLLPASRMLLADITFAAVLHGPLEFYLDPKDGPDTRLSSTKYAETPLQCVASKKEKAPAPAPAATPKAPKEKKPVAKDDDDENEPGASAESNFNLEDWKRAYSDMDPRGDAGSRKWFYEKFDRAELSIWRIGGYFNRLETSRKYLFGSIGVLDEVNNSILSGVLTLRGPDYKPVVEVAPGWGSYEYRRPASRVPTTGRPSRMRSSGT
ncbi:hypothetical protein FRC07_005128 [Ceratobasidium sp. 392]|nr:hypothetical protein FRC07_005128 [Ceratobasidium sp. 392]